jgi:hypothetical protein
VPPDTAALVNASTDELQTPFEKPRIERA